MSAKAWDIVGLGVSTLDFLQVVENFPSREGILRSEASALQGGGPVSTALVCAKRLGARCAMIDGLGTDWRGDLVFQDYSHHGVETRYLLRRPDTSTTLATVLCRKRDGQRSIVYSPGTAPELSEAELPLEVLGETAFLHLNGRHWPTCIEAARVAKAAGAQVSFDGGADRFKPEHQRLLALTDFLIVAQDYAEKLAGQAGEVDLLLDILLETGAHTVGITAGEKGSWFATSGGERFHQPAYPVTVVDTTGCGDVFHGAFLFALSQGRTTRDSARFASAAAALNATALGGRGGLPTCAEVDSLITSQPSLHP